MRYKLVCSIAILLIATPLKAQELTPFMVETVVKSTVPTMVRTGEPIKQTYRVRYVNLESSGQEVIFWKEDMEAKLIQVSPFEAISLERKPKQNEPTPVYSIDKNGKARAVEYFWDFEYTLRIIDPEKKIYKIPSFNFWWSLKDAGTDLKQVAKNPFPTDEVFINYVSLPVPGDPYLDVRDNIYFGSYYGKATFLWYVSRVVGPVVFLISFAALAMSFRNSKKLHKKISSSKKSAEDREQKGYLAVGKDISFSKSYRKFFFWRKKVSNYFRRSDFARNNDIALLDLQKNFVILTADILRAKFSAINPGDTPADMKLYMEKNISQGVLKQNLIFLTSEMIECYRAVESGDPETIKLKGNLLLNNFDRLAVSVSLLKSYWLALFWVRALFSKNLRQK